MLAGLLPIAHGSDDLLLVRELKVDRQARFLSDVRGRVRDADESGNRVLHRDREDDRVRGRPD